ncbi:PPE family protein [Mycobacterium sp.]|uniref:PPE family protein n=1 Tax=Mycobacterium sp. TaxID=1785 RepID=UPI002CD72717|nr:PPE family protein [Mycobacterium sp.]HTQ21422.1 PPE family protein [Mycobacterium sp.]
MIYGAFPPEFNSGRMYSGAGAGSLIAAAQSWQGLASELQSTVAGYSSIVDSLVTGPWSGPSSAAMLAAVTPYLSWIHATAGTASEAAAQATAAASAYETAFAAHVPPVEIAANRTQLAQLVATNVFGQNTASIAATEIQYGEMWVQDALAMNDYTVSSASATKLTPFTAAPQVTNASGIASQAAATSSAAGTAAGTAQSLVSSVDSLIGSGPLGALLQIGANLSTEYTDTINGLLNGIIGPNASTWFSTLYNAVKVPLGVTTQFNDIGLLINFPASQFLKFAPHPALGAIPRDALGAGLGGPHWSRGTLFNAVQPEAHWGRGTLVGRLTVPPSWATATPGVRMVAAALSSAGAEAVPAAALGEGSLLSSMAVAGMLGSALGAGAPDVVKGAGVRGRLTPLKDLKDATSPEKLKRLVAQISEKPESVQHHNVDQEGLDALLEQLAKKPGIHAVHLSKGGKVVPTEAKSG